MNYFSGLAGYAGKKNNNEESDNNTNSDDWWSVSQFSYISFNDYDDFIMEKREQKLSKAMSLKPTETYSQFPPNQSWTVKFKA